MNEAKETLSKTYRSGRNSDLPKAGSGRVCEGATLPLTTDAAFMAHAHRLKAAISAECAVHP